MKPQVLRFDKQAYKRNIAQQYMTVSTMIRSTSYHVSHDGIYWMHELRWFVYLLQVVRKLPRNWRDIKCQKTRTGMWWSVQVCSYKSRPHCCLCLRGIKLYSKTSNELLCEIRHDHLGFVLPRAIAPLFPIVARKPPSLDIPVI